MSNKVDNIQLGLIFIVHSGSLCFLVDVFRPFTFIVIINIVRLISTTFVTTFYVLHLSFLTLFFCLLQFQLSILYNSMFSLTILSFQWLHQILQYTFKTNLNPLSINTISLHEQCKYFMADYFHFYTPVPYNIVIFLYIRYNLQIHCCYYYFCTNSYLLDKFKKIKGFTLFISSLTLFIPLYRFEFLTRIFSFS